MLCKSDLKIRIPPPKGIWIRDRYRYNLHLYLYLNKWIYFLQIVLIFKEYNINYLFSAILFYLLMVCTHSSRRENSHVSMEGGKVVGGWGMADRTEISKFKKVMRYFPDRWIFPHVWSLGVVQWQIFQNFIDMKKLK